MEQPTWLDYCSHSGVSMGIYYSRHNYAAGCFVSQSIRSQLFIRLPVIALCWRLASYPHYTIQTITHPPTKPTHTYTRANMNRQMHMLFSLAIYHYKNKKEALKNIWQDDNCSLLSFLVQTPHPPTEIQFKC